MEVATKPQPTLRMIPLAQIQPDPKQPRKHYDAQELTDLACSIAEHGVLQPILVRPLMVNGKPVEWLNPDEDPTDTVPGCGWSDPPPTPEWVWHRLMDVLDADNGYNHHWSCHDFNAAKEPITALIGSGFFRDDPQDLDGSFWQAASGEASERLAFFAGHNETLARLDEAVNEVFDGPAENPMQRQFNAAIDFAISCGEGQAFLEAWREGDWDTIRKEFPKFQGELPA